VTHTATLGKSASLKRGGKPDTTGIADLKVLLGAFLSATPRGISSKQVLAQQLAIRCHDLCAFLVPEMQRQENTRTQGTLWGIYGAFQQYVDSELKIEDFASAFAQTLAYSLFLAKLNVPCETPPVTLDTVQVFIPSNFVLIKELAKFLNELNQPEYQRIGHKVEEILGLMNNLDLKGINEDLSFDRQTEPTNPEARLFERDPYIYFYEDFLKEYNPKMRESRGVYYTPPPVVNFIMRGVNSILKGKDFNIADGLADPNQVQILDFATGTGTFLLEALMQIFEEPSVKASKVIQDRLIKDHALKNLYGFEYLIAPYTIAHLKLSQFLKAKGYQITEPLKIYLTNTLGMTPPQGALPFMQKLKAEGDAALKIKTTPVLIIVGNPPYNVKSKNKGEIDDLVRNAYAPQDEKKMNWDDYVKFIWFAHHKMEKPDRGVVGIITNNSYLNAVTLRKMRKSLMDSFDAIYILNLHGNSLISEKAPDGKQDANVFDIRVGTCIAFFVKTQTKPTGCKVYYADIKSSVRLEKYQQLVAGDMALFQPLDVAAFDAQLAATRWAGRFGHESLSFFVPSSDGYAALLKEYGDFWGITDIFQVFGTGVKTDRDDLVVNQDRNTLENTIRDAFGGNTDAAFKKKYRIENSSSYCVADLLNEYRYEASCIGRVLYRPFDTRYIYYKVGFTSRPAWDTMRHMVAGPNIAIDVKRQNKNDYFDYILAAENMVESCLFESAYANNTHIPLYLYPFDKDGLLFGGTGRRENFTPAFRKWVDERYNKHYTPEQVLGYIYAILHSPTYRATYQEFLKIDFPRIQFVHDPSQFEKLAALGWELVEAHTMKPIPAPATMISCQGTATESEIDCKVTKVSYDPETQRLYFNNDQYFVPVPPEAWEFTIGGYQVLDKYLKERKRADRVLEVGDLLHIPRVAVILSFTHAQMTKIDGTLYHA
jgi:predicted helicase